MVLSFIALDFTCFQLILEGVLHRPNMGNIRLCQIDSSEFGEMNHTSFRSRTFLFI
jgi:hypothetical protein